MVSISKCFPSCKIIPDHFKLELQTIFKLAWPLVVCDIAEFFIPVITLEFVGQYGELALAAGGLGMSFCNVFGVAVIIGLDTATATLCSQSYGAKNFRRYGIVIQRALLIQLVVAFTTLAVWINAEKILLLLQQEKDVSSMADKFIVWRMPSLILQGFFKTMKSYLVCQHIVLPFVAFAVISIGFCVICNLILVNVLQLGIIGSSITINLTYILLCAMTFGYITVKKIYRTWPGWSWDCLLQWPQFASLALPGSLMIIFDWTTAETGVFLLGRVGKQELGAQSVLFNILSFLFMVPLGISLAAGISIGRYLGSGEPKRAQTAAKCAISMTWSLSLCMAALLIGTKDYIGFAFTKSKEVIEIITKVLPLLAGFHLLDATQGVCAGIMRGLGLQKYGATVNFIGFDLIGLPLGAVFALVLHWSVLGFWGGLAIGMLFQVVALMAILAVVNWKKLSLKARSRAGQADPEKTSAQVEDENKEITELVEINNGLAHPVDKNHKSIESIEIQNSSMDQEESSNLIIDEISFGSLPTKRTRLRNALHISAIIGFPGAVLACAIIIRVCI